LKALGRAVIDAAFELDADLRVARIRITCRALERCRDAFRNGDRRKRACYTDGADVAAADSAASTRHRENAPLVGSVDLPPRDAKRRPCAVVARHVLRGDLSKRAPFGTRGALAALTRAAGKICRCVPLFPRAWLSWCRCCEHADTSRFRSACSRARNHSRQRTRGFSCGCDLLGECPGTVVSFGRCLCDARFGVSGIWRWGDVRKVVKEELLAVRFDALRRRNRVETPAHFRAIQQRRNTVQCGRGNENRALAASARAPGPATPVRVRIDVRWGLGVKNTCDVLHVDAARGHVRGDERIEGSSFEGREGLVAFSLIHLAGERINRESRFAKQVRQFTDVRSGASENEGWCPFGFEQQVHDRVEAFVRKDEVNEVFDVGVGRAERRSFDARRLALNLVRERQDFARKRGRHEMRSMAFGRERENRFEVVAKAEIEHAIRFVEHDGAELRSVDRGSVQVVQKAAGRADNNRGTTAEGAAFITKVSAACDACDADVAFSEEPGQLGLHLLGELARRRDDEGFGARCAFGRARGVAVYLCSQREADRYGFTRTRLRAYAQVTARQLGRENGLLDRCK
jgi:hypothetical protein